MDGKEFISRQNWPFHTDSLMMTVFFPICTFTWCVNNYVYRPGTASDRRNESTEKKTTILVLTLITTNCVFRKLVSSIFSIIF